MTKIVRMYVREIKAKYNREYKQLNFDKSCKNVCKRNENQIQ